MALKVPLALRHAGAAPQAGPICAEALYFAKPRKRGRIARCSSRGGSSLWTSGAASILCLTRLILADPSYAGDWLQDGSYEIAFRLEFPHLERWGVDKKTIVCVSEGKGATSSLAPILSDNNPFVGCSAKNVHRDEDRLTLDIVCSGRDAAKARASYTLFPGGFRARIAMTMGAKNMTMTEVQIGHRIGNCPLANMLQD